MTDLGRVRPAFVRRDRIEHMNLTAVLHSGFGVAILAGILVSDTTLRVAAFGLGAVLFVAGIAVSRRDDGSDAA
jgi:hypothetical protein